MRRAAILVAIALVLGACGDDDEQLTVDPGTTSTVAPQPATSAPAVAGGGTAAPSTGSAAPPHTTPTEADGPAEEPPDANGPPGSYAAALLRASTGERMIVEVASQSGAEPTQGTLDHVADVLGAASAKSVSLSGAGTPPANDQWTGDSLRAAAKAVAVTAQGSGVVVLRLLFVHGHWAEDDSVLGVSFQADAAAIFVDDVRGAADPLVGPGAIEVATTTHEVGHLLGLVDLYLHTGREDPEHPGHSTNTGSVMYWAVESSLVTDLLTGGPPRDFDDADRADLAAIRG